MSTLGLSLLILSAAILASVSLIFVSFLLSEWTIRRLDRIPQNTATPINLPSVSVIFAARNEQEAIEQAAESMLQLQYPNLELIIVDDRSTDQTPAILEQLCNRHQNLSNTTPKLHYVRIDTLPDQWLGKCHALCIGANQATGEWLLFTDADVQMHPKTLSAAISFAEQEQADHVTLAPYCTMPTWILCTFVATFAFLFKAFVKPFQIANPKSPAHVGIGAFNLVRRSTYQAIGGHESIRLCPDDDVKLGKRIKQAGYAQRFANGLGLISVPWYPSLRAVFLGLEKNCFAGIDYSITTWLGSNLFIFTTAILPWLLAPFADGYCQAMLLITCALWLIIGATNALRCGYRIDHGLALPIGIALFLLVLNRSILLTFARGGIYWRDTFYSLKSLRAFHRQLQDPQPPPP